MAQIRDYIDYYIKKQELNNRLEVAEERNDQVEINLIFENFYDLYDNVRYIAKIKKRAIMRTLHFDKCENVDNYTHKLALLHEQCENIEAMIVQRIATGLPLFLSTYFEELKKDNFETPFPDDVQYIQAKKRKFSRSRKKIFRR